MVAETNGMEEHLFIQTVERHRGAIERVCRSFSRNDDELDDLRQEVLMALWSGWKRYRPEARTVTWVWRVALNSCISWRRRQSRQVPTVPLVDFDPPDDDTLRRQSEQLQAMIALLPVADQRLIGLYLDGWTARETGLMLGLTESNVTTRLTRIRQKLKKMNDQ